MIPAKIAEEHGVGQRRRSRVHDFADCADALGEG